MARDERERVRYLRPDRTLFCLHRPLTLFLFRFSAPQDRDSRIAAQLPTLLRNLSHGTHLLTSTTLSSLIHDGQIVSNRRRTI